MVRRVFRGVPTLMVEPQASKRGYLEQVRADLPEVRYASQVLSARAGETVTFYEMETGSSFLPEQSNAARRTTQMTTSTLDNIAADVPGNSLFLKIDVQGAELQVLNGGAKTLERARVVQLETALLPYNKGAPSVLEVLSYMEVRGFHPFDLSGFSRVQGHLVQVDILFARRDDTALRPDFINF
ncbi:MAG: FkbM family methyltransferase [Sphingomonas sp.]|nr:FkbM family methyltransferase [Sphingomonas sp.]